MKHERTLKQIDITLRNVEEQTQIVLDAMNELIKVNPEYETYYKLLDYVAYAIYDVHEKMRTL